MIAQLLKKAFRPRGTVRDGRESPEDSEREGEAFKQKGDACLKAGELSQAELHYRAAVARSPKDARSHFMLGFTLRERAQTAEALARLNAALAIDPDLVDAYYVLGSIHQAEGRTESAIAHFQRVLALRPGPRLCLS